jgi:ATP-binding cassette subfamily F protein uup
MKSPNFLILDEPTNDLDIITLNVLEEYLSQFKGCVLVVSHDRYFLDKVVEHIFEFRDDGTIKDFPGNYTQLREIQKERDALNGPLNSETEKVKELVPVKPAREKKPGLTFKEKKEIELLETEIGQLQNEKNAIESELNSGILVTDILHMRSKRLNEIIGLIDEKELRWLELSEK